MIERLELPARLCAYMIGTDGFRDIRTGKPVNSADGYVTVYEFLTRAFALREAGHAKHWKNRVLADDAVERAKDLMHHLAEFLAIELGKELQDKELDKYDHDQRGEDR